MQRNPVLILSTRKLSDELMTYVTDAGFEVDELDFITTQCINNEAIVSEIHAAMKRSQVAIFTSKVAVEAVAMVKANIKPGWKIYCIRNATREIAEHHFGADSIIQTANNSIALAHLLVKEEKGQELIFFCGDRRRDELPDVLRFHDIPMKEIVVYKTVQRTHFITKPYAGILFYSPSAVQSFFTNNTLPETAILFAIGSTTAAEIMQYSSNQIIISDASTKEHLIKTMISHFKSSTSNNFDDSAKK